MHLASLAPEHLCPIWSIRFFSSLSVLNYAERAQEDAGEPLYDRFNST